jgi:hypothetical protein
MVTLEVHLVNGEVVTVEKNVSSNEAYRRLSQGPGAMAALVSGADGHGRAVVVPATAIAYVAILSADTDPEPH